MSEIETMLMYGHKMALMELDVSREGIVGEEPPQQAIATQQQIESEEQQRDRPFNN